MKKQKSLVEGSNKQEQFNTYLLERAVQEKRLKDKESPERKRMMILVIEKVAPVSCEADHEIVTRSWRKTPEFCRWFLENEKMLKWFDRNSSDVPKMWLNGMPGAGTSPPYYHFIFMRFCI